MSPLIAPQAAIAADTPQIDTAVESMAANSSSTRSLRASQKHEYQTTNTTSSACTMPSAPACSTSWNNRLAPRMTRPVLMKNSVCTAGLSHDGVPIVLLMRSPSSSAKMTYSMPKFTNTPLPARKRASQASAKITGSPIRNGATRQPTSAMPIALTIRNPRPT